MPFVDPPAGIGRTELPPPPLGRSIPITEAIGEGFLRENVLGRAVEKFFMDAIDPRPPQLRPNPHYDPFAEEDMRGLESFRGELAASTSHSDFMWRRRQIERAAERMEKIRRGGVFGQFGMLLGSLSNPSAFIGVTGVSKVLRPATRLEAGAATAGAVGAVSAAEETALGAMDPTRTAKESAITVATATTAGFLFGALARGAGRRTAAFDSLRYADEFDAAEAAAAQSVGAAGGARTTAQALKGEELVAAAFGLEKLPDNPVKRVMQSASLLARDTMTGLTELPFFQNKNLKGEATAISAWENYRKVWRPAVAEAMKKTDDLYLAYRERVGADARKTVTGQMLADSLFGAARKNPARPMTYGEFRVAVGKAKSELGLPGARTWDPEVIEAARYWNDRVYMPIGKSADELGLLTKNLERAIDDLAGKVQKTVDAAEKARLQKKLAEMKQRLQGLREQGVARPDYLNRIWRNDVVRARRAELASIISRHQKVRRTPLQIEQAIDAILRDTPFKPIHDDAIGKASSLHERSLWDVPDRALEDFLVRDIAIAGQQYGRTMGVDVELARAFGSHDMAERLADIAAEYDDLIKDAPTPAERLRLEREKEAVLRDLRAVRDQVRGTYSLPEDPTSLVSRAIRGAKWFNAMTQLTGAISAIPDVGRLVMTEGLKRTLEQGLKPFLAGVGKQVSAYGKAKRELNLAGEALETYLGVRAAMLADLPEAFATETLAETMLQRGAGMMFNINLMNQWTDAIKTVTAMMVSTRILEDATKLARGQAGANVGRLGRAHIDRPMADRIAAQFEKHGETLDHVWLPNTDLWTDEAARETFRAALAKDVNIAIVTPAPGERALWTSTEWGGLVAQFKGFGMASFQRVLVAGLQERDANFVMGTAMMVGLGAIAEAIRAKQNGRDPTTADLLKGGIDRSGVLGWFMDVNNGIERLTDGAVGLGPIMGVTNPYSQDFMSRVLQVGLGPTGGTLDKAGDLLNALSTGENVGTAVRRMAPLQSVFWADSLFDRLQEGLNR
jgi:hypothetical protein